MEDLRAKMAAGEVNALEAVQQAKAIYKPQPKIFRPFVMEGTDEEHFARRMEIEENVRHGIGMIGYGIIGAVDGVIDTVSFGVGEIAEDIAFGITRVIYRIRDGIQRGKT